MSSYKVHFDAAEDAARYDCEQYAPDSYSQLLWELEKPVLKSVIDDMRTSCSRIRYLDFASGTGRVAGFVESMVDSSASIEISQAMAARAGERLHKTQVLCRDITSDSAEVEGRYELITAFRFFLNAEPSLRQAAMKALSCRLDDKCGRMVFNNHGNLWSIKILGWPYHRIRRIGKKWPPRGNYMTYREASRLARSCGLRIIRVVGLGVLGGKVCSRMSFERALKLEAKLARLPLLARFAQNQLYVACRDAAKA